MRVLLFCAAVVVLAVDIDANVVDDSVISLVEVYFFGPFPSAASFLTNLFGV